MADRREEGWEGWEGRRKRLVVDFFSPESIELQ